MSERSIFIEPERNSRYRNSPEAKGSLSRKQSQIRNFMDDDDAERGRDTHKIAQFSVVSTYKITHK